MSAKGRTVVARQNPCNGEWEIGWLWADGLFIPAFIGYPTKEMAEADIPGLDARLERELAIVKSGIKVKRKI